MSQPYEAKLTDALKGQVPTTEDAQQAKVDGGGGHSVHPEKSADQFNPAAARQHNSEVNQGLKGNKDRLVDIGRGEDTAGRH